jgi:hypothetical protein
MANKQWSDLTTPQRWAVCLAAATETVLTVTALRDLVTRPADQVRGPKAAWALALFVQPVGPLAYLAAARRGPGGGAG